MDLYTTANDYFEESAAVSTRFFQREAAQISLACCDMARRFVRNGRLLAFAAGNSISDAQHVSVEFLHPVIVGKRALPAIALGTDLAATVGAATASGWGLVYAQQLAALGRAEDIALGIDPGGNDAAVCAGLEAAAASGMLTIGLCGGDGGRQAQQSLDYCFVVDSDRHATIQETHETLYHVFWELVHLFFEHKGLLNDS